MTDLASWKKKRGSVKKKLTEFKKYVTAKEELFNTNTSLERKVIIELECRLTRIMPVLDEMQDIQSNIDESETEESNELELFESNYYSIISSAKFLLEKVNASCSAPTLSEASIPTAVVANRNTEFSNVKLPTIELPKFNGKFTSWLEFRDTYNALIHSSDKLSDVQKFIYLKSFLEGDAAKIISSMETSASSYQTAWTLLCERYENKRLLVHNHLRALFNMPSVAKESAIQLREILDNITQHLRALEMLKQPIEHWDAIIVFIVTSKFDSLTARDWEMENDSGEIPTLSDMRTFLRKKVEMLEALSFSKVNLNSNSQAKPKPVPKTFLGASNFSCYYCHGKHTIYNCKDFLALSTEARKKHVLEKKLCLNCLRTGHMVKDCTSRGCKTCQMKHNSLLHIDKLENPPAQPKEQKADAEKVNAPSGYFIKDSTPVYAILSTAQVRVEHKIFRALLDTGSQSNLLTKAAAEEIGAKLFPITNSIKGLGDYEMRVIGRCQITINSEINSFSTRLDCLVVDKISSNFAQPELAKFRNDIPKDLALADSKFDQVGKLDILIGNGVFWTLISNGNKRLGRGKPVLQNTSLGWILAGPLLWMPSNKSHCHFTKDGDIQNQLAKFWQIEECPNIKIESEENKTCEEHFNRNHRRDDEDRFTVSIPFKKPLSLLGDSKIGALKRFYNLEHKLKLQPQLKAQYVEFMEEYIKLNHMSQVNQNVHSESEIEYYIPHHCVTNESSVTTKLRVVFDASFATTTGHSLNSLQHIGPTIQSDLFAILLRFRQHAIAISADIKKMYRQVLVKPEERSLQKVFWRSEPSKALAVYKLNTVTYGMTSASYLAIRCLHQLAIENSNKFPEACKIIMDNFYVDDLLSGTDDIETASVLCEEISNILKQGCFPLHKWLSNVPRVLERVKDNNDKHSVLSIGEHERTKTLGLYWTPTTDVLGFNVNACNERPITKRTILSMISQIFDPLGLLGACIIKTKILLQAIWQEKLDWDDDVPYHIRKSWNEFQIELTYLNNLNIPRRVICPDVISLELHGYSDASERAYGACIYLRSEDRSGQISSYLLCSKAKVAPLKTLTVPRLELCAALLLAKLANKVLESLTKSIESVNLWCDSQIILAWLNTPPSSLKIFVANRVIQILEMVPNAKWSYVPTESNPADLISRGISPRNLISSKFWWEGPNWLLRQKDKWPEQSFVAIKEVPETRSNKSLCLTNKVLCNSIIKRFSSFNKLIKVISTCIRFIENCRRSKMKIERKCGPITAEECSNTLNKLLILSQAESYAQEIQDLSVQGRVQTRSPLVSLTPFLDKNDGLMRISGRLHFSELPYDERHPIILSSNHHLTYLILLNTHLSQMHAGVQQMICSVREKFWPVNARKLAKRHSKRMYGTFSGKAFKSYSDNGKFTA